MTFWKLFENTLVFCPPLQGNHESRPQSTILSNLLEGVAMNSTLRKWSMKITKACICLHNYLRLTENPYIKIQQDLLTVRIIRATSCLVLGAKSTQEMKQECSRLKELEATKIAQVYLAWFWLADSNEPDMAHRIFKHYHFSFYYYYFLH